MTDYAVLAVSGADTAERLRLALSGLLPATGPLVSRSGLLDNGGGVSVSQGMQVTVAPFRAYIQGTAGATQGGYLVVLDTPKTLTVADGGPTARTDIVVARVRDTTYDGTGQTAGTVELVQGAGGAGVPATPAGAVKLAEIPVPANTSAGTGGLSAGVVDKRPPRLVAAGGVVPVTSAADRDTLTVYPGLTVWRMDLQRLQTYTGTAWPPDVVTYPECRVTRTSDWRVPANQIGAVPFEGVAVDNTKGQMWAAAAPTNVVIPKAGIYALSATTQWNPSSGTDQIGMVIMVNGVPRTGDGGHSIIYNEANQKAASVTTRLAAGDVVTLGVTVQSGAAATYVQGPGSAGTMLEAVWLRD